MYMVSLTGCIDEFNPFIQSNANVTLTTPFKNGDTVTVFSTFTVKLQPHVQEYIDSFSITVPGNRYWQDSMITKVDNSFLSNYLFNVSFFDTGKQHLTLTTYPSRKQTDNVLLLYAQSPLYQESVTSFWGDTVTLKTARVADNDCYYCWDFGKGTVITSLIPETTCVVKNSAGVDSEGHLWVMDFSGNHHCPAVSFRYTFNDTTPPVITCLSDSMVSPHMIKTGDTTFFLKFNIYDPKRVSVDSVIADAMQLNAVSTQDCTYIAILSHMSKYTKSNPRQVVVRAMDNQFFKNWTRDTFEVYFDSTMTKMKNVLLNIHSDDSVIVGKKIYHVTGNATRNFTTDTLQIYAACNGITQSGIVFSGISCDWAWDISLDQNHNTIIISIVDKNDSVYTHGTRHVIIDTTKKDVEGPVIKSISVNNMPPLPVYSVTDTTVSVGIIAYDEFSSVQSIFIQDKPLIKPDSGHTWHDSITVYHSKSMDTIRIRITDTYNNSTDTLIRVRQNTPPELKRDTLHIDTLIPYTTYIDSLLTKDNEMDPVAVTFQKYGIWSFHSESNTITCKPKSSDLGSDTIHFTLTDTFGDSRSYAWCYYVIDTASTTDSVSFSSVVNDQLPSHVKVAADTLSVVLRVDKGTAPYRFSALLSSPDTVLLENTANTLLSWSPTTASDTGDHTLTLSVTDSRQTHDTIIHHFSVVQNYNYPCSLSIESSVPITPGNIDTINLNNGTAAVLTVKIHDQDHPYTESHTLLIQTQNGTDSHTADSLTYTVIPVVNKTNETIVFRASDISNNQDTRALCIIHPHSGISPDSLQGLTIWHDAGEGLIYETDDDNRVIRWENRGDTSFYQTIDADPGFYPTFIISDTVVHFNKSNKSNFSLAGKGHWAENNFSVFAVVRLDNSSNNTANSLLSSCYSTKSFNLGVHNGKISVFVINDTASQFYTAHNLPSVQLNTFCILHYNKYDFNKILLWFNDSTQIVSGENFNEYNCAIGASITHNNPGHIWGGDIAEIIVYNRSIDSITERNSIINYLRGKYSIR